ncbi:MAG: glycosyltransferase [Pseudomonadota bacterium]
MNTVSDPKKLEVVFASRRSEEELSDSHVMASINRLPKERRPKILAVYDNSASLPTIYNSRIESDRDVDYLLFVHDDVWIDDYFFVERICEGLEQFDVIGVAGSRSAAPNQAGWLFKNADLEQTDIRNVSVGVAHGASPGGDVITRAGPWKMKCDLLDGVFLAVKKQTLLDKNVRFDPSFRFHHYDLDFCRTASRAGLTLGTWPICITHSSGGSFRSEAWKSSYERYVQKWEREATA